MGKIHAFYTMPHPPIVIPEVGKGGEQAITQTSDALYKVADEIATIKPDTIIIVTPHGPLFHDAVAISYGKSIHGSLKKFAAPEVQMTLPLCTSLIDDIIKQSEEKEIPTVKITENSVIKYGLHYELDHGATVPLYFVNQKYKDYEIVHITYGMLSSLELYQFGMCIKKAVEDSSLNAVFIASGDLSHRLTKDGPYEYSPYGEKFDKELLSHLTQGNVTGVFHMDMHTIDQAGECGLRSYYIMLGAMHGNRIQGDLLSYEGPFGVGYSVMRFDLQETDDNVYAHLLAEQKKLEQKLTDTADPYVTLARASMQYYLENKHAMDIPNDLPADMLNTERGVFVSLKKEGRLRGCIGTILPTKANLAQEIISNAVAAAVHDPRFHPVRAGELPDLDVSVDVLTTPKVASIEELNPKQYGVIVRSGRKTGLLLPDLEGIDTAEEQLSIAMQKGNISFDEDFTIETFEVIRHH